MKFYLSFIIIIYLSFSCFSQKKDDIFRAVYNMTEIRDSINQRYSDDIINLELYPTRSFCYSKNTWFLDSLNQQPNGDKIWDEMFIAAIKKEGVTTRSFPRRKNKFEIIKNFLHNEIITYDMLDEEYYVYPDSINSFSWTLNDTTALINGYPCASATCSYHGRNWEAWFCPDLPWQDGPWKLCGLPGLIVKAHDDNNLYSFELKEIIKIPSDQTVSPWAKNVKKTERRKFLKNRYKYLIKLENNISTQLGIPLNTHNISSQRYRIGLESDYDRDK
ncbi:MAG: GLPGLI family protein [Muribaculaceae bacterium]|nr:GLPGLI family protein [Muribaculaceae bacterium]